MIIVLNHPGFGHFRKSAVRQRPENDVIFGWPGF
jgi:hypothetical protein